MKKTSPASTLKVYVTNIKSLPNGYVGKYVISNFCSEILPGCIFNLKSKHIRVLRNKFGENSFLNFLTFFFVEIY